MKLRQFAEISKRNHRTKKEYPMDTLFKNVIKIMGCLSIYESVKKFAISDFL